MEEFSFVAVNPSTFNRRAFLAGAILGACGFTPRRMAPTAPARLTTVLVRNSAGLLRSDVQRVIDAVQIQLDEHVRPFWGVAQTLQLVADATPVELYPEIRIERWSNGNPNLGDHFRDPGTGMPVARIFMDNIEGDGLEWPVTFSHEAIEQGVNPFGIWVANAIVDGEIRNYALEPADPTNLQEYGYRINGIPVSNFVTPWWFASEMPGVARRYDFMGRIAKPYQALPGSKAVYWRIQVIPKTA